MIRISFRQSLLAGFLLIALLAGWAALQGWRLLEQFVEQSRQNNVQALRLTTSIQELAARTVDLERSARQYMVLKDATVLGRFDEQAAQAVANVEAMAKLPGSPVAALLGDWSRSILDLAAGLRRPASRAELLETLERLGKINDELDQQARQWIDARQEELLEQLEKGRRELAWLVVAAAIAACVAALVLGLWLSRSLGTLERAIERLGESRFDQPVAVRGPADLRQVGRRLDWLRQRLGELEAERERALRHVSHELKTPLTALREGIALLQDEVAGPLQPTQQEVVGILQHNALTLQRQIESLLRLNAVSLEARRLHLRPVHLERLLAGVVRNHELQIQARRLDVRVVAPPVSVTVDEEKMQVVLDNLLSNAIDFSPDGGIIRLEAKVAGQTLGIACIDKGPGVAVEDAERIFQPFVQGRRRAPVPRQGSGVGLSIVRELVAAMGGRVQLVHNEASVPGANFLVEVPFEK